ncbi:helix-turn-helix domain-containing protein [Dysgonomonas sp. ZJ709]|uniref:helix-turn-helix domain-containing protein n=1 Tax=Dysgonomonas sp. ZJ709 TaxID=2709797 RepID=UPI0013ECEC0B|nr:helix-turn-helix domain-containing protein [Dysgonomonas sp. ZJ709]
MDNLSENLDKWMTIVMRLLEKLNDKLDRLNKVKDCLDGDELLDNQDLCLLLGVTKRTLHRYRKKGLITYYMIDSRKAYYKKSEIPDYLIKKKRK